jgi:hypothetical protein
MILRLSTIEVSSVVLCMSCWQKFDVAHQLMRWELKVVPYDTVLYHVKLEKIIANTSCTQIYIEILQNIKYDKTIILSYDTMHYGGGIY